jgi:hypothetical protein
MYEYIPNKIIECAVRTIANTSIYLFLFFSKIWRVADYYYFEQEDKDEEPCSPCDYFGCGDSSCEYFGWEYELKMFLTKMIDYFYSDSAEDKEPDSPPTKPQNISYVDKYNEQWKRKLQSSKPVEDLDLVSLKNNILFENTPFGNVIMYYDHSKNSFIYYCDKTLSYPIVNSVGRKYVITFGCERLHLDEPKEESKSEEKNNESNGENATNKNVYAKFKKYDKPKKSEELNKKYPAQQQEPQTEEQINRYTCEGKLSNFNFLKKTPKVKPFSYKDFKMKLSAK